MHEWVGKLASHATSRCPACDGGSAKRPTRREEFCRVGLFARGRKRGKSAVLIGGTDSALVSIMTTTLYRATADATEDEIESGMCFSAELETAEAYRDNPGFGGPHLREVEVELDDGDVLDITGGLVELARALGYEDPRETALDWGGSGWRYPWEESHVVRGELEEHVATWLRYNDDFPANAVTMMRI